MLRQTGFEIASEHHFSLRQNPFGWIQSLLNGSRRLPRNGLYTLLHRHTAGAAPPFDASTRRWLRAFLVVGAPLALAAALFKTLCRSGATVHRVARKPLPA